MDKQADMARKVAENIVKKHGEIGLWIVIVGLQQKRSMSSIAKDLGVSKQRIHQWKSSLGAEIVLWKPQGSVYRLLEDKRSLFKLQSRRG